MGPNSTISDEKKEIREVVMVSTVPTRQLALDSIWSTPLASCHAPRGAYFHCRNAELVEVLIRQLMPDGSKAVRYFIFHYIFLPLHLFLYYIACLKHVPFESKFHQFQ